MVRRDDRPLLAMLDCAAAAALVRDPLSAEQAVATGVAVPPRAAR